MGLYIQSIIVTRIASSKTSAANETVLRNFFSWYYFLSYYAEKGIKY